MKIVRNNITNATGTYIVNTSNTRLILGSGISMAIKRHCGIEIQKEMSELAPIKQGEVVKTSAGRSTQFEAVLHAAITDMKLAVTLEVVSTALRYIDEYCDESSKLIIPLLGTGIGGLNRDEVLTMYKEFYKDKKYEVEVWVT